jgi:hypothetical protein
MALGGSTSPARSPSPMAPEPTPALRARSIPFLATCATIKANMGCVGAKSHLGYEGCWIATTMPSPKSPGFRCRQTAAKTLRKQGRDVRRCGPPPTTLATLSPDCRYALTSATKSAYLRHKHPICVFQAFTSRIFAASAIPR